MAYTRLFTTAVLLSAAYGAISQERYLNDTIPAQWQYAPEYEQRLPNDDAWWLAFNDTTLNRIIDDGIKNNYDLLMAKQRIAIAKSGVGTARSAYMPELGLTAEWIDNRTSGRIARQSTPVHTSYYSAALELSWQIDLFGKISKQVDKAKSALNLSKSDYYSAMITLCGNIATYYFNLRTYQKQYAITLQHTASQKEVCDITRAKYMAGLVSRLDVAQAEASYHSTMASLPSISANIDSSINSIAIILGKYPEEIRSYLSASSPMPTYYHMVSVGIPLNLLRRRPDILAAEAQLKSAAISLGIAQKDFLPTLSIGGNIGFNAHKPTDIFSHRAAIYSITPKLTWTIFSGLSRKYSVQSAHATLQLQIDNYNSVVLTAYSDVANAMNSYRYSTLSIEEQKQSVESAREAVELSLDLYRRGLTAFNNLLTSQQSYLEYYNSLIATEGTTLISLVNLYEALGGGWQIAELQ